jgi:hypothetical protein
MSYALASPVWVAARNRAPAPPARESAEMLRNYLREMNARYQEDYWAQQQAPAVIGYCFYCQAPQYEDLGFCCSCGYSLRVEYNIPTSLRGLRKAAAVYDDGVLYASSFHLSRKSFWFQRAAHKAAWHMAVLLLIFVPYYAVCKVTLGDSFPRALLKSYERVELAMESAAIEAFTPRTEFRSHQK